MGPLIHVYLNFFSMLNWYLHFLAILLRITMQLSSCLKMSAKTWALQAHFLWLFDARGFIFEFWLDNKWKIHFYDTKIKIFDFGSVAYFNSNKTFHWVVKLLTSWCWPWSLTYFWKKNTLNNTKNFCIVGARAFIFYMYIFCNKTFLWMQTF